MPPTLYNDIEAYPCQWLRNLIEAGLLPYGAVYEGDFRDLDPAAIPSTFHSFCGIGGWPYALRLAGWPDDKPVWTASLPCQPLSSAGQRKGHADKRHLWPAFHDLIAERRPPVIFGEQVASKDGREWFAGIRADLEQLGYACGGADLPAACVGAPHIRQRLFWVAVSNGGNARTEGLQRSGQHGQQPKDGGTGGRVAYSQRNGRRTDKPGREPERGIADRGAGGGLGNAQCTRLEERPSVRRNHEPERQTTERTGNDAGFWDNATLIPCGDGKTRRIESGIQPLANGIPARLGKLRAAGNAIVPQVAAEFIKAFMEATE